MTTSDDNFAEYVRRLEEDNRLLRRALVEKVDREPDALMPAIEAYVDEEITAGKLRQCIVEWLAGRDFLKPEARPWEARPAG